MSASLKHADTIADLRRQLRDARTDDLRRGEEDRAMRCRLRAFADQIQNLKRSGPMVGEQINLLIQTLRDFARGGMEDWEADLRFTLDRSRAAEAEAVAELVELKRELRDLAKQIDDHARTRVGLLSTAMVHHVACTLRRLGRDDLAAELDAQGCGPDGRRDPTPSRHVDPVTIQPNPAHATALRVMQITAFRGQEGIVT